jgi:(1->4)-alpha-D-glucan 1-alpha-D-glucosylmutase
MGLVADIVPNHVGIASSLQPWWRDVLRYGPASPFARFFDIDWEGLPHLTPGVLLLPILGAPLGDTLEAGELPLELHDGEIVFRYWDHALPLAPSTYADVLQPNGGAPPPPGIAALLPRLSAIDHESSEAARAAFGTLVRIDPAAEAFVRSRIAALNGSPGHPRSFDRLEAILFRQHYRPRHWRTAGDEINYRRFFVISDLAALRIEDPEVFNACHTFVFGLVAESVVDALRVDHVGGLADPPFYLGRLRAALDDRGCHDAPIFVEKILARDEPLAPGWPVAGTTGYDFLAAVDGLFIDPGAERALTRSHQSLTGNTRDFASVAYAAKREIAGRWFTSEIDRLAVHLDEIAASDRRAYDLTLRSIRDTVLALLSAFPVYRLYKPEQARQALRTATREAAAREPLDPVALEFVARTLEPPAEGVTEDPRRTGFRRRFGHLSVPIVAKGAEDTAFYRYSRLLSLNEVGADPEVFATSPASLHRWLGDRSASWPQAMSASTTHDTKRSEDVRARLNALSEFAAEWHVEASAWFALAGPHRGSLDGRAVPSPELEYYLYQSLVGSWPGEVTSAYRHRIAAHLTKAMREAAAETSWTGINAPYEQLSLAFLDQLLADSAFIGRLHRFVATIEPVAILNSLSALVLKTLAPGIPDFYQGSELPLLTLTDPDNRAPVDFAALERRFENARTATPPLNEPAAKLWLTHRLLAARRRAPAAVSSGSYVPLVASGAHAERVFAFARHAVGEWLVVLTPRLVRPLLEPGSPGIPASAWGDTSVDPPRGVGAWESLLDHRALAGGTGRCADLLATLPFAVLLGREVTQA